MHCSVSLSSKCLCREQWRLQLEADMKDRLKPAGCSSLGRRGLAPWRLRIRAECLWISKASEACFLKTAACEFASGTPLFTPMTSFVCKIKENWAHKVSSLAWGRFIDLNTCFFPPSCLLYPAYSKPFKVWKQFLIQPPYRRSGGRGIKRICVLDSLRW